MPILDAASQAKDLEKEVARYEKFKKEVCDTLFIAFRKNGDAYHHGKAILYEGEKEIAKARKELADCIERYDDIVKQTNRNRELVRQIGKGLEEAMKQLTPLDKELKSLAEDGDKLLKVNKNHAALSAALTACATARKDLSRVSAKAVDIAQQCEGLKVYEPIER
jgi:hypothetical protein